MDVRQILTQIGYVLSDDGKYYRAKPLYRDSDNSTSLQISKDDGSFKDWGTDDSGSLALLVKKTLGVTFKDAYKILGGSTTKTKFEFDPIKELSDGVVETFSLQSVGTLLPHHKHFLDRGVSKETLEQFGGGVSMSGYMRNRYTFPIYDINKNIIGFSGRALFDKMLPKWKNKGKTRNWLYPLYLNKSEITTASSVYLVESIGDLLALWEVGIKNVIVLFGVKISKPLLATLVELNIKTIYVSLNNEPDNNSIGNIAAEKICEKLTCFFDDVQVRLPFDGDFGDMLQNKTIFDWVKKYGTNS